MTTQLTAINWAKVITIVVITVFILVFGISGQRQILYACMHISYCVWWLLEQKIYPERRRQIFTENIDTTGFVGVLLIVGLFYSLPAFFAFTNPTNLSITAIATAIPLFSSFWDLERSTTYQLYRRFNALLKFQRSSWFPMGIFSAAIYFCVVYSTY